MSKDRDGFEPGDYRRVSSRLEFLALSEDEKRINRLLDFIRTDLETHIYNSYKASLEKGDFFRVFRIIDEKVIPAITDSQRFTTNEITQAKNDLLQPIILAAQKGNKIARDAIAVRPLPSTKYINAFAYKGRTQDRLMENRELLEIIDQSIQEKNGRKFENARATLVNRVLEGKEAGREQIRLMKDLEELSDQLSRMFRAERFTAPAPTISSEEIMNVVSEVSVTDLALEAAGAQLIDPEKYEKNVKDALTRHHDLVGRLNLAIADNNIDGIKTSANVLNDALKKEGLTFKQRGPLKEDTNIIFQNIKKRIYKSSAPTARDRGFIPEKIAAQALAVVSSSSSGSVSDENEHTELDSARVKRQRRSTGRY